MSGRNLEAPCFVCHICGKVLSSKQILQQHLNVHTGDKPYKCNFDGCTCAYKHASQLSNHKIIHKMQKSQKKLFYDMKTFVELLLIMFKEKENLKYSTDDIKKTERIELPPLTKHQENVTLPSFTEVFRD